MAIVIGLVQHRAQITADWLDRAFREVRLIDRGPDGRTRRASRSQPQVAVGSEVHAQAAALDVVLARVEQIEGRPREHGRAAEAIIGDEGDRPRMPLSGRKTTHTMPTQQTELTL